MEKNLCIITKVRGAPMIDSLVKLSFLNAMQDPATKHGVFATFRRIDFNFGKICFEKHQDIAEIKGFFIAPEKVSISPHVVEANKHTMMWADEFDLIKTDHTRRKLQSSNLASISQTMLAAEKLEHLQIVSDYLAFICVFDDLIDDDLAINEKTLDLVENIITAMMSSFKGTIDYNLLSQINLSLCQSLSKAIFDIAERLQKNNFDIGFFEKSFKAYLDATLWEMKIRISGDNLSENNYRYMRQFTITAETFIELGLSILKINVPAESRANPLFKRLLLSTINIMALTNDLISVKKEINEKGHNENIVILKYNLAQSNGTNAALLQTIFDKVVEEYNNEVKDFLTLFKYIPASFAPNNLYLALANFVNDQLDWHLSAKGRFKLEDSVICLEERSCSILRLGTFGREDIPENVIAMEPQQNSLSFT